MFAKLLAAASLAIGFAANANPQAAPLPPKSTLVPVKPPLYARAQTRLKQLGHYNGPVNGQRDPLTIAAIKKFQAMQNLPVSGRLTPETVKALGV